MPETPQSPYPTPPRPPAKKKPVNGRAKGARVELELVKILSGHFTATTIERIERNLQQSRGGGHDIHGLLNFAIECKSNQSASARACWDQTVTQAAKAGRHPVLFRKMPFKDWEVYLPLSLVMGLPGPHLDKNPDTMVMLTMAGFVSFATQRNLA
jgi:hypothetical protein